jgi:Flp pilus assembly protein TadB
MSVGAAILVCAVTGLALGIVVSVTTDVPLAPEVGLVLGALAGWLWRRDAGSRRDLSR